MDSGIYKLLCTTSGKFYIGSSQQLGRRKVYHFNRLRANKHPNSHLQNSYNLYGEQSFSYEIIKYCPISDLLREEQQLIDHYWDKKLLFNAAQIAGASFRNRRHKKTTINKMKKNHGKAWLGKHLSDDHKRKISQKIMQLIKEKGLRKLTDKQVLEIRSLSSKGFGVRPIARMLNIPRHNVNSVVKGKRYKDIVLIEESITI